MIKLALKKIKDKINNFSLPTVLLRNFIKITDKDIYLVRKQTAIERRWYKKVKPFTSIQEILLAAKRGQLVKITPTKNYCPILRLRNNQLIEKYPPFLTTAAKNLLDEISEKWRSLCSEAKIDSQIRLAITSLVRTQKYQDILIKSGKLAMPNSPHMRAEAFDIDASGYYLGEVPINPRSNYQKQFAKAFSAISAELSSPPFGDYRLYNPLVHQILLKVLKQMKRENKLNFVYEYPKTTNACLHICRNPDYLP